MLRSAFVLVVAAFTTLGSPGGGHAAQTITWQALAPATGKAVVLDPKAVRSGTPQRADFDGSQEDFEFFLEDMELMREMQPKGGFLASQLHDQEVRIAGYVTPVGFDDENVTEFLFVPFLGACIHVPPPEANQIIHVTNASGIKADDIWQPVWLTGRLQAKPVATVLADVGYRMVGANVAPYDGDPNALEDVRSIGDGDG